MAFIYNSIAYNDIENKNKNDNMNNMYIQCIFKCINIYTHLLPFVMFFSIFFYFILVGSLLYVVGMTQPWGRIMEVYRQLSTLDSLDSLHYGSRRFCRATDQRWDLGDYALAQHQGPVKRWRVYESGRNGAGFFRARSIEAGCGLYCKHVIDASVGNPRHVLRTLEEDSAQKAVVGS